MPFDPKDLFSGTIIVCDRVLQEVNGALSAIRIADLLTIRSVPTEIQAHAIILIKSNLASSHHLFEMTAENPDGEIAPATPLKEDLYIDMRSRTELGTKPGAQIVMDLRIAANNIGTYILRALVDKVEVAKATLTLQLPPSPQS